MCRRQLEASKAFVLAIYEGFSTKLKQSINLYYSLYYVKIPNLYNIFIYIFILLLYIFFGHTDTELDF